MCVLKKFGGVHQNVCVCACALWLSIMSSPGSPSPSTPPSMPPSLPPFFFFSLNLALLTLHFPPYVYLSRRWWGVEVSRPPVHTFIYIGRPGDLRRWKQGRENKLVWLRFLAWVSVLEAKRQRSNSLDVGSLASHLGLTQWPWFWGQP